MTWCQACCSLAKGTLVCDLRDLHLGEQVVNRTLLGRLSHSSVLGEPCIEYCP